jgi:O-antigen ligase
LAVSFFVVFALYIGFELATGFRLSEKFNNLANVTSRVPLWMAAWSMFRDAPLFGHGPGSFSLLYETYISSLTLPSWAVFDARHMPWPHNLYLELLAERGLIGLLSFLAVLFLFFRQLRALGNWHSADQGLLRASAMSLFVLLIAGCVDLSWVRLWVLVSFAMNLGLLSIAIRRGPGRTPGIDPVKPLNFD